MGQQIEPGTALVLVSGLQLSLQGLTLSGLHSFLLNTGWRGGKMDTQTRGPTAQIWSAGLDSLMSCRADDLSC